MGSQGYQHVQHYHGVLEVAISIPLNFHNPWKTKIKRTIGSIALKSVPSLCHLASHESLQANTFGMREQMRRQRHPP